MLFTQYYTKKTLLLNFVHNNLPNGVLIVKIGYALTDLQAIEHYQNCYCIDKYLLAHKVWFEPKIRTIIV